MALENILEIEKALRLPEGTLTAAIASEDATTVEIPQLSIRTVEDEQTFVNNMKDEFKTAGREIAIKEARTEHGLEFEGKTIPNLLEAYKSHVLTEAKAELGEPDKKVTSLTEDVRVLTETLGIQKGKYTALENTIGQERSQRSIESKILGAIPDNTIIPKEDILNLFKNKHTVQLENDQIQFVSNGEVMKNDLREPVKLVDMMDAFITPYAKKVEGGAGGGDETATGKAGSMEAFRIEMEKAGHSISGQEANQIMIKRIADGTLKV